MQTQNKQGLMVCSIHGDITEYYHSSCSHCQATIKTKRQHPKLAADGRIYNGVYQNLRNGIWQNPFDRAFARWAKK